MSPFDQCLDPVNDRINQGAYMVSTEHHCKIHVTYNKHVLQRRMDLRGLVVVVVVHYNTTLCCKDD